MARWYASFPLDRLLTRLDVEARETIELGDVVAGVHLGERLARLSRIRPDTCLFRSLSRYALLRRSGYQPRFVMGIDRANPEIGHAWIELGGATFLESSLPLHRPTFEHPPREPVSGEMRTHAPDPAAR